MKWLLLFLSILTTGAFSVPYVYADYDYNVSIDKTSGSYNTVYVGGNSSTSQQYSVTGFKPSSNFSLCQVTVPGTVSNSFNWRGDGTQLRMYAGTTTADGTSFSNTLLVTSSNVVYPAAYDNTYRNFTYWFDSCFPLIAGNYYQFVIVRTVFSPMQNFADSVQIRALNSSYTFTTGAGQFFGGILYTSDQSSFTNQNHSATGMMQMTFNARVIYSTTTGYGSGVYPSYTATASSSSYDVTGSATYCDANFPPTGYVNIANNLCLAGGYMFIPNSDALDAFKELPTLLSTKMPFAYFSDIYTAFGNLQPAASGSTAFNGLTINFPGMYVATNSMVAIPSVTFFSTTTFRYYLSDNVWAFLKSLMAVSLYMAFALHVFMTIRNLIKT